MAPSTASSRSASSRMMLADLPPSSSVTFFTVSDAIRMISAPTTVLPVNAILSTSGWVQSVLPNSAPGPVRTLMTPGGNAGGLGGLGDDERGQRSQPIAGFKTIVFPMTMACAIFQEAMLIGKFQGMMPTQTPIGSRRMYSRAGAKTLPEKGISSSQGNFVAA